MRASRISKQNLHRSSVKVIFVFLATQGHIFEKKNSQ